jgi:hypothetical protein
MAIERWVAWGVKDVAPVVSVCVRIKILLLFNYFKLVHVLFEIVGFQNLTIFTLEVARHVTAIFGHPSCGAVKLVLLVSLGDFVTCGIHFGSHIFS